MMVRQFYLYNPRKTREREREGRLVTSHIVVWHGGTPRNDFHVQVVDF